MVIGRVWHNISCELSYLWYNFCVNTKKSNKHLKFIYFALYIVVGKHVTFFLTHFSCICFSSWIYYKMHHDLYFLTIYNMFKNKRSNIIKTQKNKRGKFNWLLLYSDTYRQIMINGDRSRRRMDECTKYESKR
jgi:hypothetical protein